MPIQLIALLFLFIYCYFKLAWNNVFFMAFLHSICFVHVQSTMFSSSPDPSPQPLSPEYCPFLISYFTHTYLIYILYIYTYCIYLYTYLCKFIYIICSIVYERSMQYLYLWLSLCHLAWWSWVLSVCGVILQFMADYTLTMLVYQFSFPILLFKNYYFFCILMFCLCTVVPRSWTSERGHQKPEQTGLQNARLTPLLQVQASHELLLQYPKTAR